MGHGRGQEIKERKLVKPKIKKKKIKQRKESWERRRLLGLNTATVHTDVASYYQLSYIDWTYELRLGLVFLRFFSELLSFIDFLKIILKVIVILVK